MKLEKKLENAKFNTRTSGRIISNVRLKWGEKKWNREPDLSLVKIENGEQGKKIAATFSSRSSKDNNNSSSSVEAIHWSADFNFIVGRVKLCTWSEPVFKYRARLRTQRHIFISSFTYCLFFLFVFFNVFMKIFKWIFMWVWV